MTTNRSGSHHHDSGRDGGTAAVVAAAGIAAVLVVRWLSGLDDLALAGLAAGTATVLFGCWAVWPQRRLPRHRVRHMRLRARLRLHPGHGHATVAEL